MFKDPFLLGMAHDQIKKTITCCVFLHNYKDNKVMFLYYFWNLSDWDWHWHQYINPCLPPLELINQIQPQLAAQRLWKGKGTDWDLMAFHFLTEVLSFFDDFLLFSSLVCQGLFALSVSYKRINS